MSGIGIGIIVDHVQGSAEWHQDRLGDATASRIADVMAYSKRSGEELQARKDYRAEKIAERLTGRVVEHYVSADMMKGTADEPLARAAYEIRMDCEVETVGYVFHPAISHSGCSPDGLVGNDGLMEIKCPRMTTHIKWMMAGSIPEEHLPQMMWQLACTGRQWCDFVSYNRRFEDKGLDLFIRRLERNDEAIGTMEREVRKFLCEVDAAIAQLADRAA